MMERRSVILSPSLLAAGADHFSEAIHCVEQAGAEWLHIDVMDGHFVPNLSFGPNIVSGIRACSRLFFDVHLMVARPLAFTGAFIKAGADAVTVHPEAQDDVTEVLSLCRKSQIQFGLAVKPETSLRRVERYLPECDILLIMGIEPGFGGQKFMPEAIDRIREAASIRSRMDARYRISVDGGINAQTGEQCILAGADVLVAGSAIFGNDSPQSMIAALKGVKV